MPGFTFRLLDRAVLPVVLALASLAVAQDSAPTYARNIRPLLADRCFTCHGPDAATRQADLRLDIEAEAKATREGGAAIVAGSPEESQLWARVSSADENLRMPPVGHPRGAFSRKELDVLERWLRDGARYEDHWAWVPPKVPPLPEVKNTTWAKNPLDLFVLSRLEAAGTGPSADAEPGILLRRLFLAITGLPPTVAELDAFVADPSEAAYTEWVRKLLEDEPYRTRAAEHWTRPWLDAARYADTIGIHTDNGRTLWPWRDRVIESFREHLPWDRFVHEQLAGDLLPDANQKTRVASGFNRAHVITDEGGAIPDEYLVEYAVDRTSTFGTVFLGLTLGCARCHDHKYDPISQADFYRLFAFFNSNEEPGLYSQESDSLRAFEPAMSIPDPEQLATQLRLESAISEARSELDRRVPDEESELAAWRARLSEELGLIHAPTTAVSGHSNRPGETISVEPDGSFFVSGEVAATADHTLVVGTEATNLRLITLHALADPRLPAGRVGRAPNGNAVLSGITVTAIRADDSNVRKIVKIRYGVASLEQKNGDYAFVNALDPDSRSGWAVDAHMQEGDRVAWMLAEEPFGFEGGTRLEIQLRYRSIYAEHQFGRVHFGLASLNEAGLERLPVTAGNWRESGPYPQDSSASAYASVHPLEAEPVASDPRPAAGGATWRPRPYLPDGVVHPLPSGLGVSYAGRELWSPSKRKIDIALGSDDGLIVLHENKEVLRRVVDRGAAPDQDRVSLELAPGRQSLILKVVNTGGESGYAFRRVNQHQELEGGLLYALLPPERRSPGFEPALADAWRLRHSPRVQAAKAKIAALEAELSTLRKSIPNTMVMREMAAPKAAYVLKRGRYDSPDGERATPRGLPEVLGAFPSDFPRNRLGLALWLTSKDNPLFARVSVNRFFEQIFGVYLVRTPEDFGLQGELPTHPELLDFLALEFQANGFSVPSLLRSMVSSRTFRQSSAWTRANAGADPEHRLLGRYPRRRLTGEELRDQALYLGRILVERTGGRSVKPYQPPGLWEEVAMPASNTRAYVMGGQDEWWRRSLYTYWKRAAPPPSMLLFDAPTRESCQVRRHITNTPLQALALWNDPQFVGAARALADVVVQSSSDDAGRIRYLYRAACGREPTTVDQETLGRALTQAKARYAHDAESTSKLVAAGQAPKPEAAPSELAPWILLAQAVLCSDASVSRN